MQSRKHAFTLIELLVVIAIIAILAAILFPVFAQAKAAAKKTTALSNIKQVTLGTQLYSTDSDDLIPPVHNCLADGGAPYGWFCGQPTDWNYVVKPYTKQPLSKTESMFKAVGVEADFYGTWTANPVNGTDEWNQKFSTLGMNVDYLQPSPSCNSPMPNFRGKWGAPASGSMIEAPADTVFMTETKPMTILSGGSKGAFYPSNVVNSPAAYGPNTKVCPLDGWGKDGTFETENIGGPIGVPYTGTGYFMPRHTGSGVVTFCDGHAKAMKPGQLAAGTNWSVDKNTGDVMITDLSKYLWSLRKSGSDL